jgi:hypothetical protein
MARFRIQDIRSVEVSPTSPGALKNKLGEMLFSSINATARIERFNPETGEYRIVLQGVLDREESRFETS